MSSWASGTNRVESRGEGVLFGGFDCLFFFIFKISGMSGFTPTSVILFYLFFSHFGDFRGVCVFLFQISG